MRKVFRFLGWFVLLTIIAPIAIGVVKGYATGWPSNWRKANWSSSGLLRNPDKAPEAEVLILASRTGQWKSIFAEHMSIVLKRKGDAEWTRYDVVGWGTPVRKNDYVADAFWYGNAPRIIYRLWGAPAEDLIPKIESSIAAYPNQQQGSYVIWPGPNSNTFVSWVVRHTEGFDAQLSSVAVGKDYLGQGLQWATSPSKSGYTFSYGGYVGATAAIEEGLELHLLGSTIGLDPKHLAIKLPALGTIGLLSQ